MSQGPISQGSSLFAAAFSPDDMSDALTWTNTRAFLNTRSRYKSAAHFIVLLLSHHAVRHRTTVATFRRAKQRARARLGLPPGSDPRSVDTDAILGTTLEQAEARVRITLSVLVWSLWFVSVMIILFSALENFLLVGTSKSAAWPYAGIQNLVSPFRPTARWCPFLDGPGEGEGVPDPAATSQMFGFFPLAKFFLKPVREHLRRSRKARKAPMANAARLDTRGRPIDSEAETRTPPEVVVRTRSGSTPRSRANSRADSVAYPDPPSALLMETFSPPSQRGRATIDESSGNSESSSHSQPRGGRRGVPARSRPGSQDRSTSPGDRSSDDADELAHRRLIQSRRRERRF